MAVYTNLSKLDLDHHLQNYNIGKLINFKGIVAGIDNSNFIIESDLDKFILTIFESRINQQHLPFFIELTKHLSNHEICCPKPIFNKNSQFLTKIKNKTSVIVTFLKGKTLEPNENGFYSNINKYHCFEIGKIAAKMHLATADFQMTRENDLGVKQFLTFFNKFSDLVDDYKSGLKKEIIQTIEFINSKWDNSLPSGVIHSDLFPDNVFFNDEDLTKVSGVIDFYFAANDLYIYDFACIVNAWCFSGENNFIKENFDYLLKGYESIRNFNTKEKDSLNIAFIAASLRFLLTRLHDMFFTKKDSLVKIKDPQEYINKLNFFIINNKIF